MNYQTAKRLARQWQAASDSDKRNIGETGKDLYRRALRIVAFVEGSAKGISACEIRTLAGRHAKSVIADRDNFVRAEVRRRREEREQKILEKIRHREEARQARERILEEVRQARARRKARKAREAEEAALERVKRGGFGGFHFRRHPDDLLTTTGNKTQRKTLENQRKVMEAILAGRTEPPEGIHPSVFKPALKSYEMTKEAIAEATTTGRIPPKGKRRPACKMVELAEQIAAIAGIETSIILQGENERRGSGRPQHSFRGMPGVALRAFVYLALLSEHLPYRALEDVVGRDRTTIIYNARRCQVDAASMMLVEAVRTLFGEPDIRAGKARRRLPRVGAAELQEREQQDQKGEVDA